MCCGFRLLGSFKDSQLEAVRHKRIYLVFKAPNDMAIFPQNEILSLDPYPSMAAEHYHGWPMHLINKYCRGHAHLENTSWVIVFLVEFTKHQSFIYTRLSPNDAHPTR